MDGKTLTEHRADRAAIVRAVLTEAGIDLDAYDTHSATVLSPDGRPRYLWSPVDPERPRHQRLRAAHAADTRQAASRADKPPRKAVAWWTTWHLFSPSTAG